MALLKDLLLLAGGSVYILLFIRLYQRVEFIEKTLLEMQASRTSRK